MIFHSVSEVTSTDRLVRQKVLEEIKEWAEEAAKVTTINLGGINMDINQKIITLIALSDYLTQLQTK